MALKHNLGGDGSLFVGEDKILDLRPIYDGPVAFVGDVAYVADVSGAPTSTLASVKDITGWTIKWFLRVRDASTGAALLEKTATIDGTFNVSPSVNTQKARVVLTDDDLNTLTASGYRYSWKRMDDGSETVLAYGDFRPEVATAR